VGEAASGNDAALADKMLVSAFADMIEGRATPPWTLASIPDEAEEPLATYLAVLIARPYNAQPLEGRGKARLRVLGLLYPDDRDPDVALTHEYY